MATIADVLGKLPKKMQSQLQKIIDDEKKAEAAAAEKQKEKESATDTEAESDVAKTANSGESGALCLGLILGFVWAKVGCVWGGVGWGGPQNK